MIDTVKGFLQGKKTYLVAALWFAHTLQSGGILTEPILDVLTSEAFIDGSLQASGLSTVRASISRMLRR